MGQFLNHKGLNQLSGRQVPNTRCKIPISVGTDGTLSNDALSSKWKKILARPRLLDQKSEAFCNADHAYCRFSLLGSQVSSDSTLQVF